MLQLISNNSGPLFQSTFFQEFGTNIDTQKTASQDQFLFDFQIISSNLYVFRCQDFIHELTAEITFEQKGSFAHLEEGREEDHLTPVISCDFPPINTQKLNNKVFRDDWLQAMILFQFQLKILKRLLLFCNGKEVTYLILNFNESNLDYLEVYQRFFLSDEQAVSVRIEKTQIIIPIHAKAYDEIADLMDNFDNNFHRALWREQKNTPTFQKYLKKNFLLEH